MRFFKASITIENSKNKYGNLPIDFVLGYENSNLNEVYFCLHENVSVPEDAAITEIKKNEYDAAIEIITQLQNTKKQDELDAVAEIIANKNNTIIELQSRLSSTEDVLLEMLMTL